MGSVPSRRRVTEVEFVAVPLVYALLSSKTTAQYYDVLYAIDQAAEEYGIPNFFPQSKIMGDFEQGIISACQQQFPETPYSGCFFHFTQSIYRNVQSKLQMEYADPNDRSIRDKTRMIMALALVPVADVKVAYRKLKRELPQSMNFVCTYFENTYVGRVGKRPRYPIELWNHYDAALQQKQRTNNASEGWHNRFQLVVGKHHPDLYSALREIQKEQADTEISILELSLGRSIKNAPKKAWKDAQNNLCTIAQNYEDFKERDRILEYLEAVAFNIVI